MQVLKLPEGLEELRGFVSLPEALGIAKADHGTHPASGSRARRACSVWAISASHDAFRKIE
jgi:hypothetical protein